MNCFEYSKKTSKIIQKEKEQKKFEKKRKNFKKGIDILKGM